MPIYIAMLRGVNVSGHNLLKMEALRASFEALGFTGVKTYLQSGNVVFETAKTPETKLADKIARKLLDDFQFSVSVLIRAPAELEAILTHNPFPQAATSKEARLYVTFLSAPAAKATAELLQPLATAGEQIAVAGREIYLHCPSGYGNTKLSNTAIEKKLSLRATTRNWRTVTALHEMAQE